MHSIILICSASLAILTILLAFWTSIQRGSSSTIAYGAPLDPASAMAKAQRAHGNAAEYSALLIALFSRSVLPIREETSAALSPGRLLLLRDRAEYMPWAS
ncbi:MAG: MAPEG family protein [Pseudomonadota bacterium]